MDINDTKHGQDWIKILYNLFTLKFNFDLNHHHYNKLVFNRMSKIRITIDKFFLLRFERLLLK